MKIKICLSTMIASALLAAAASAQVTVSMVADRDNTLYEDGSGSTSNGSGPHLFMGATRGGDIRRPIVHFDVASSLPVGAAILSAELRMVVDRAASASDNLSVHRLTTDWGEGTSIAPGAGGRGTFPAIGDATWVHNFFASSIWAVPGGDFDTTPTTAATAPGGGQFSITGSGLAADVQSWMNGTTPNYGWILLGTENTVLSARRIVSREGPNAADRPTLIVTYQPAPSASKTLVGTGCSTAGRPPLLLDTVGLPTLGNAAFMVTLRNGVPGGTVDLYLSTSASTVSPLNIGGGCNIYLDIPSALVFLSAGISPVGPLPLDAAGGFDLPVPIALDPTLAGASVHVQAIMPAAFATASGGLLLSNALSFVIGV